MDVSKVANAASDGREITVDLESAEPVLKAAIVDGYVCGVAEAADRLRRAGLKAAPALVLPDWTDNVDFEDFEPGDGEDVADDAEADGPGLAALLAGSALAAKGIADTTATRLGNALGGASEGTDLESLASQIVDDLERGAMIALTIVAEAAASAAMDTYRANEIEQKVWATASGEACDECITNEDDGPIPMDEMFSSGDDEPPLHPNCMCEVYPVTVDMGAVSSG